jgi:uncharacterized membrane protein YqjE
LDETAAQSANAGPVESLKGLGETLAEIASTRAELFAVELQEESQRLQRMIVFAALAAVFLAAALLLVAGFVVLLFWDTHRVAASAGVTILYAGVGAWAAMRLRALVRNRPPPFEATLEELRRDFEMVHKHDG